MVLYVSLDRTADHTIENDVAQKPVYAPAPSFQARKTLSAALRLQRVDTLPILSRRRLVHDGQHPAPGLMNWEGGRHATGCGVSGESA